MSRPRVVGLDLSMTGTGIADEIGRTVVKTATVDGDARIGQIVTEIMLAVDQGGADLVVIEDLPTHAHAAGITGMVHGAVRMALRTRGLRYALVPPASLKKYATGKGNASKGDMRLALYKRTGVDDGDDNRVDAEWLRMMGLDRLGHPLVTLPVAQHAALDGVRWPALDPTLGDAA